MNKNIRDGASTHHHAGKTSEKLLNKEEIINSLDVAEGQTILDAGCGNGYMAVELAKIVKNSGKVYAMDLDEISIKNLLSSAESKTIEVFVGDITTTTKLAASSIDLIYLSTVIHGFSEAQMSGFTAEIQRLLKPNGILAILEIKKEDTPLGPPLDIRFSPEELRERIPLAPLKTVNIGEYFYLQLFKKTAAAL